MNLRWMTDAELKAELDAQHDACDRVERMYFANPSRCKVEVVERAQSHYEAIEAEIARRATIAPEPTYLDPLVGMP